MWCYTCIMSPILKNKNWSIPGTLNTRKITPKFISIFNGKIAEYSNELGIFSDFSIKNTDKFTYGSKANDLGYWYD